MAPAPPILGIDLGSSFVSASVYRNDKVERIPNRYGNYQTPSYVAFTEQFGRLVGEDAKEQETINPKSTIYGVKSLIGQKWEDEPNFPFSVENDGESPKILLEMDNETVIYSPVEILSALLETVKQDAEQYLGETVKNVVITVPAYFRYFQRHLICEAASIAGMDVENIITEPEAVALAYACRTEPVKDQEKVVMIVDIGGAGLNTCIAAIENGVVEIKAVAGDKYCGGQVMVSRMVVHFVQEFKEDYQKDLCGDQRALARLRVACEKAVMKLSISTEALVQIDQLYEGIDFCGSISRPKFDMLIDDLVWGYLEPLKKCLKDAKMNKGDINNVLVIGGCSQIPRVRKQLIQFFEEREITFEENGRTPGDGAAIFGAIITGHQSQLLQDLLLLGVTPISLGIKSSSTDTECNMTRIIGRNTTIPTKQTQTVEMPVDENVLNSVSVEIYEGERVMTENNHFLGRVTLRNLRLKHDVDGNSLAKLKLEITFDIDTRNKLNVTVVHKETNNEMRLNVSEELTLLRTKELEVMKTNAMKFRVKWNLREWVLAKDQLVATCFKIEKALGEEEDYWKEKVSQEVRNEILDKIESISSWIRELGPCFEKPDLEQKLEEVKAFCRVKNANFLLNL